MPRDDDARRGTRWGRESAPFRLYHDSGEGGGPVAEPSTGGDVPSLVLVPGAEPLPGYRLLDPLGKGGYGEVWKAEGPGGVHVALKFVRLLEPAGPIEQRALGVIKRIRHPHLLT